MKSRIISFGIIGATLGAGIAFVACSSSKSGDTGGNNGGESCPSSSPQLTLSWNPGYSGTDGVHTFQIPELVVADQDSNAVSAANQANYTWSASDESAVTISAPNATGVNIDQTVGGVMVTVKNSLKNGETITLTAVQTAGLSGGGAAPCGTASLTLDVWDAATWQVGNTRYNSGAMDDAGNAIEDAAELILYEPTFPAGGKFDAAGIPLELAEHTQTEIGNLGRPCYQCHTVQTADVVPAFASGIAHTPYQTGGYSDSNLQNVFEHGIIYDGGYFEPIALPTGFGVDDAGDLSQAEWTLFHHWNFDESTDEENGILIYLRALPPIPSGGSLDVGGGQRPDGGGYHGDGGGYHGDGGTHGDGGGTPPVVDSGTGGTPDAGSDATVSPDDAAAG